MSHPAATGTKIVRLSDYRNKGKPKAIDDSYMLLDTFRYLMGSRTANQVIERMSRIWKESNPCSTDNLASEHRLHRHLRLIHGRN